MGQTLRHLRTALGQAQGQILWPTAVETHREQLGIANRRIDELQAALAEERRRLLEILTESWAPW